MLPLLFYSTFRNNTSNPPSIKGNHSDLACVDHCITYLSYHTIRILFMNFVKGVGYYL